MIGLLAISSCAGRIRELPPRAIARLRGDGDTSEARARRAALAREILSRLEPALRETVHYDPRLDRLALAVLELFRHDEVTWPAGSLMSWMTRQTGVISTYRGGNQNWGSGKNGERAMEQGLAWAIGYARAAKVPLLFGLARSESSFWATDRVQVIVFAHDEVELEPLPGPLQPGATITLRGHLHAPFERAKLFADSDNHDVTRAVIEPGADRSFSSALQLPKVPGHYRLQIDVADPETGWDFPAAVAALDVGVPAEQKPDEVVVHPPKNPGDRRAWPARFLARYDEVRRSRGLQPLRLNPVASQLAEQHARRFAEDAASEARTHFDSTVPSKLRARAVAVGRVEQIPSQFEFVDEAAWLAVKSPPHRLTIIDPAITEVGIGCAPLRRTETVCMQYFIAPH